MDGIFPTILYFLAFPCQPPILYGRVKTRPYTATEGHRSHDEHRWFLRHHASPIDAHALATSLAEGLDPDAVLLQFYQGGNFLNQTLTLPLAQEAFENAPLYPLAIVFEFDRGPRRSETRPGAARLPGYPSLLPPQPLPAVPLDHPLGVLQLTF